MTNLTHTFRALMFATLLALSLAGVRAETIVTVATQAELELRIQQAREQDNDGLVVFECDGIIVLTNTIVLTNSILIETNIDEGDAITLVTNTTLIDSIVIDATGHFIAL